MFLPLHDRNPLIIIPFQRVTVSLMAISIAVYLYQLGLSYEALDEMTFNGGLKPGEWFHSEALPGSYGLFTWLSHMFMHGDFWHLAGNMLFLWVFGDNIEDAMGHLKFLAFYLLGGLIAGAAHALSEPSSTIPMVGASGAISAVLGAYLMLHPKVKVLVLAFNRIPVRLPAIVLLVGWILMQFISLGDDYSVAWWAHIGGFFAGVFLVLPFKRKEIPLFDRGLVPGTNLPEIKDD